MIRPIGPRAAVALAPMLPNRPGNSAAPLAKAEILVKASVPKATTATVVVDPAHTGAATVAGYTVAHVKGAPAEAVVVADTAHGTRAVACTRDVDLLAGLREGEWCGRSVQVQGAALVGLDG